MPLIIFIILSVLVLFLVCGGYVFFTACKRKTELPWLDEEAIQKTHYKKYAKMIQQSHRWLMEHGAKDIWIESEDGLKLHAYWVANPEAVGTILLAHGYRSTPLVDFGPAFAGYYARGMNLLIPTQRSHGKSAGKYITFGVKESADMLGWLRYHNDTFGALPMVLSGLSMGASTVMYMLDEELPSNVKGVIVDCGFTSPRRIIGEVFHHVTHMPDRLFLWSCEWYARIFGRFSLSGKDSRKTLAKNKLPIMMAHGVADGFVPCFMTEEGYAKCNGDKRLLLVEGADHGVSFLVEPEKYSQMIDDLFLQIGLLK